MGWKFTIATTGLLLLVVLLYYLDTTPSPPPRRVGLPTGPTPQGPAPSGTPLVVADPQKIYRLLVTLDGVERMTERINGTWVGTDRAELIEEFVRDLTRLGPLETIEVDADRLSEFGFLPPRGRIELYLEGQTSPVVFEVGLLNPPGTALYLRVPPSRQILLVGSLIDWELQRTVRLLSATPGTQPTPGQS